MDSVHSKAVLNVTELSYKKGDAVLLNRLKFTVNSGEILAVIGANGAGKTSLINVISQEVQASSGTVLFDGQPFAEIPPQQRSRQIAILPQFSSLNFPFTVEQVVLMGRRPHQTGRRADREIVAKILSLLDIHYLANRSYLQLSGGEKQRTQIARVMAQIWRADGDKARLLILDEPTTALDLGHKQQLMAVLRSLADDGVAILLVEHDLSLVNGYSDQLLALKCGFIHGWGNTRDTLTEELIFDLFGAKVTTLWDENQQRPRLIL